MDVALDPPRDDLLLAVMPLRVHQQRRDQQRPLHHQTVHVRLQWVVLRRVPRIVSAQRFGSKGFRSPQSAPSQWACTVRCEVFISSRRFIVVVVWTL